MDRRQKAAGGGCCAELLLSMMIAALLRVGADQSAVESVAKSIIRDRPIPAHCDMQKYADEEAQIFIDRDRLSNILMREEDNVGKGIARYIRTFRKEPYFGLPIGEMSLSDQIKEIQRQIQVLNDAFSSGRPIPDEPMQEMGAGLPPPIFCTGSNHCAIASMLSLVSVTCMLLGYTGNAPPRSFSIVLGDAFKSALKIRQDRCIVIEDIFANLKIFLRLLGEQFPPYSPFLDCIFSVFSSKTFSKNHDGSCSLHLGSNEVLSSLKMLEESIESLGDRLQHALLSCGSERMHSHLQMSPRFISAFGLPCASLDIDLSTGLVKGLLPQIPFTAESMASFQLFGKAVGSDLQFDIKSNLFAAICDTRGRNQNFGAEDAQNVGTSHYYIVICTDGSYFLVDSSRVNVQEISQAVFLQNVNDNGIVIFMRNKDSKLEEHSSASSQKHSAGGGCAAAVPAKPPPSSRKSSAGGGCAVAVSAKPAPSSKKPSAGGGAAAVLHQTSSFGHSQPPCPPRKPAHLSSQIVGFDGSDISDLSYGFALYDAVIPFARKSESCTSSFKVTNLTLVKGDLENACPEGVQVSGSFITSEKGSPEIRFRAVGFQFDDNSVVNYQGTVASLSDPEEKKAFMVHVNKKWQSSMITAITFARCN